MTAARLTQLCADLCAIGSETGNEAAACDHLHAWAKALPTGTPVWREGNNLVVGAPASDRPTVALVGHIDTVPANPKPMAAPVVEGDRLVALGASDMKGGIAVMQALFEDLAAQGFGNIAPMLVLYDKEEGPYADNGLEPVLQQHAPLKEVDLAIAMEPTDNTLQLGCVGSIQATITFKGQAAHSARPWQGDNAIHKAGPLLAQLLRRGVKDELVAGLTFREAVNVTLASGGTARNVIPDTFSLNVNYRFAPKDNALEAAMADLRAMAQGAELTITDAAPHGPVPTDNPLVHHLAALCQLTVLPKQAWTDVARLAAHGIDAVNFGPGATAAAHQVGEWIDISAMVQSHQHLSAFFGAPFAS